MNIIDCECCADPTPENELLQCEHCDALVCEDCIDTYFTEKGDLFICDDCVLVLLDSEEAEQCISE